MSVMACCAGQIKQLTEEKLRLEAQIKTLMEGEAALRGELERRPPLDFDPAKTKVACQLVSV